MPGCAAWILYAAPAWRKRSTDVHSPRSIASLDRETVSDTGGGAQVSGRYWKLDAAAAQLVDEVQTEVAAS
jgi:hypothetical protein